MLIQDGQGHVAEQRRQDRPLRGSGAGLPEDPVLTEDAGLQERLHQGQDALVPDASPHSIEKSAV